MTICNPLRRLSYKGQTTCVIIGGLLVHLSLGTLYTIGNLNPYLASYLRARVPNQGYVSYALMNWLFAATVIGQTCMGALGGYLEYRMGPKLATFVGCLIMSFGVFITHFTISHSFWLTLFTYGIIVGVGTGIGYNPPIVCLMKWLPNNRGLASGLILAGFGLGAFVFNQVQTAYVNPLNYSTGADGFFTEDDLLDRVPTLFLLLAGIYISMQVIGCLLLMDPPDDSEDMARRPLLSTEPHEDDGCDSPNRTQISSSDNDKDIAPRDAMKTSTFWLLWFTMLFLGQASSFMASYFKIFGQTFISNDYLLAVIGSISSIFNSFGRIIWGYLGDRYSYQGCMVVVTSFMTVWMLTIYSTHYMGEIAYLIWVSAVFLTFSGQFALYPMAVVQAFGGKYFGINYGMFFTASAVTAALNAVLTTILLDNLGFLGMFELLAGASFIGFCITAVTHLSDYGSRISIRKLDVQVQHSQEPDTPEC